MNNYCVYFWYKEDEIFPFYVGQGLLGRATAVHYSEKDSAFQELAFCEKVRRTCKKFKINIICSSLTKEEATLIEGVFISYFADLGLILTNQTSGSARVKIKRKDDVVYLKQQIRSLKETVKILKKKYHKALTVKKKLTDSAIENSILRADLRKYDKKFEQWKQAYTYEIAALVLRHMQAQKGGIDAAAPGGSSGAIKAGQAQGQAAGVSVVTEGSPAAQNGG